MNLIFFLLALITLAAAVAAVSLRNLVHCALCVGIVFIGLAGFYLQLEAEFVGFAQVLVYVGAVAILILFAVLLTRGFEPAQQASVSPGWVAGIGIALAVFMVLGMLVVSSSLLFSIAVDRPVVTVREIGEQLMGKYVLPLQVVGLLLTAALMGAVILAMRITRADSASPGDSSSTPMSH